MARIRDVVLAPDTRANQPAAGSVDVGTLYYVTDESSLERSNGTSWDDYAMSTAAFTASTVLSAAAVNTLDTVPVQLVAAPGADKIIVPVQMMFWVTKTATAFSTNPGFMLRWASLANDLSGPTFLGLNTAGPGEQFAIAPLTTPGPTSNDPRNKALQIAANQSSTGGTGAQVRVSVLYYVASF